jgi:ferredoxin
MRLIVDHQLCQGHAQCVLAAPHLLELDENDQSRPIDGSNASDYPQEASDAELLCPERAIALEP